jgi:hypothetical protein
MEIGMFILTPVVGIPLRVWYSRVYVVVVAGKSGATKASHNKTKPPTVVEGFASVGILMLVMYVVTGDVKKNPRTLGPNVFVCGVS